MSGIARDNKPLVVPEHLATGPADESLRSVPLYEEISRNQRRSFALVAAFVVVVLAVSFALGVAVGYGSVGIILALAFSGVMVFAAYFWADRLVLSMSRAQEVGPTEQPRLHNLVDGLCIAAGLPKPRVYVIDDPALNAFTTGRNPQNSSIAVTAGLIEKMNRIELEAVLAHELSHIKNYDVQFATLAVVLVGAFVVVSDWTSRFLWFGNRPDRDDAPRAGAPLALFGLGLLVLAPFVAGLMHLTVRRRRESFADAAGVRLTRYPPGLVSAFRKLADGNPVVRSGARGTAHLWIESPLDRKSSKGTWLNRMFDTHPPLEERIRALQEM